MMKRQYSWTKNTLGALGFVMTVAGCAGQGKSTVNKSPTEAMDYKKLAEFCDVSKNPKNKDDKQCDKANLEKAKTEYCKIEENKKTDLCMVKKPDGPVPTPTVSPTPGPQGEDTAEAIATAEKLVGQCKIDPKPEACSKEALDNAKSALSSCATDKPHAVCAQLDAELEKYKKDTENDLKTATELVKKCSADMTAEGCSADALQKAKDALPSCSTTNKHAVCAQLDEVIAKYNKVVEDDPAKVKAAEDLVAKCQGNVSDKACTKASLDAVKKAVASCATQKPHEVCGKIDQVIAEIPGPNPPGPNPSNPKPPGPTPSAIKNLSEAKTFEDVQKVISQHAFKAEPKQVCEVLKTINATAVQRQTVLNSLLGKSDQKLEQVIAKLKSLRETPESKLLDKEALKWVRMALTQINNKAGVALIQFNKLTDGKELSLNCEGESQDILKLTINNSGAQNRYMEIFMFKSIKGKDSEKESLIVHDRISEINVVEYFRGSAKITNELTERLLGQSLVESILILADGKFVPQATALKWDETRPTKSIDISEWSTYRLNVYYALAMELKKSGKALLKKDQTDKLGTTYKDKLNNTHLDKLLK